MARNADQIVSEQLGALHLQLVIAQAKAEAAEERIAGLLAQVSILEKQLADAGLGVKSEDVPEAALTEEVPN